MVKAASVSGEEFQEYQVRLAVAVAAVGKVLALVVALAVVALDLEALVLVLLVLVEVRVASEKAEVVVSVGELVHQARQIWLYPLTVEEAVVSWMVLRDIQEFLETDPRLLVVLETVPVEMSGVVVAEGVALVVLRAL